MEPNLTDIRGQLDAIDDQLIDLFARRMRLVADVAAYKKQKGLPILDAGREQQIIDRLSRRAGDDLAHYAGQLYRTVFNVSRSYQAERFMEYGLVGDDPGMDGLFRFHRFFGDYDYQFCPLSKEGVEAMLRRREFRGVNLCGPSRKDAPALCGQVSATVSWMGCADTLVMRDGTLCAFHTGLPAFLYMLKRGGVTLDGKKAVILGSGSVSHIAQAACRKEGARETVVVSRSGPITYADLYAAHTDAEVIINATPVGMYPESPASPVDLSKFPRLTGAVDAVCNPIRTALLMDAEERGVPHAGGLWMQAARAWYSAKLFLNREIPEEVLDQAYHSVLRERLNLILIGMPGCGKSTLGRLIAERTGRGFVDLDKEVEKRFGPIPTVFAHQGEKAFRDMEDAVLRETCRESGLVIATGGGAVLRPGHRRVLRQNAVTARIRRPLSQLQLSGRPLSEGTESLEAMAAFREPLYRACADFTVENDQTPEEAANALWAGFLNAANI